MPRRNYRRFSATSAIANAGWPLKYEDITTKQNHGRQTRKRFQNPALAIARVVGSKLTMKQTFTIITAFLLTLNLTAQSAVDSNNIYIKALSTHLDYLEEFNQERPDLITIPDIYFIEADRISTDNFPTEVNGQKIKILTREQIVEKVRSDGSFSLLAVRPVQWRNGQMEIHVIEFVVSGNKRNLDYVNQMNGSSFVVKNSPDCNGLELEKIKK